MNYYDAQTIVRNFHAGKPCSLARYDEAREFLKQDGGTVIKPLPPTPTENPKAAPRVFIPTAPTWETLCTCGVRYGMHRHGDLACFNQKWRPGNGEPQWLARKWERA